MLGRNLSVNDYLSVSSAVPTPNDLLLTQRMVTDSWGDIGEQVHEQAVGNATLPVLTIGPPTIGWRTVISYTVPVGKMFIPLWATCNSDGTLQSMVRVCRRDHLWAYAAVAIADPAAPGAPTISAARSFNMNIGDYTFKQSIMNNVGETLPTAASAVVTTIAATDAISVPLVVIAASGGTYRRLYRTKAGQPGGPWFLLHEIDDTTGGYTDTHPDSDLCDGHDAAHPLISPVAANSTASPATGVAGKDNGTSVTPVADITLITERVALAASPANLVYIDEDGLQENINLAVTLAADSQTVINLKRQGIGLTSAEFDQLSRTVVANFRGGDVNHGLRSVVGVSGNPVTGQYNIYGSLPLLRGPVGLSSAAVAGGNDRQTGFAYQTAMLPGTECVVELVHPAGAVAAAQNYFVDLVGRLITI